MTIPEPAAGDDDGRDEYAEVRLIHEGGPTSLFYQHNPLDVEGWRGDNFPFSFNIEDYTVITSEERAPAADRIDQLTEMRRLVR